MAYVLQAEGLSANRIMAIDRLAQSDRSLVVVDRAFRGRESPWSLAEIASLRHTAPQRAVLAYLSIGEAEDYRAYWRPDWRPPAGKRAKRGGRPSFLLGENPHWAGNYRVRYWDRAWQRVILDDVDGLLAQGFDGAYLDIVDGFQFFEHDPVAATWTANARNPVSGQSYRRDMVDWVLRLARHARDRRPGFLLVPQNGAALTRFDDYLDAIDGIAVEDLYTLDDVPQEAEHTRSVSADLARVAAAGKPVFVVEYARDEALRAAARRAAADAGYRLLFAARELDGIGQAVPPPACRRD